MNEEEYRLQLKKEIEEKIDEEEYRALLKEKINNKIEKRMAEITKNEPIEDKSETDQADTRAPACHCPPVNIIIQQAGPKATQEVTIGVDGYEEPLEVIQALKESMGQLGLKPPQKSDIQAEIQTIEAQMSSSKPKVQIITESIESIRRILEGAAGSVLASSLLSKIVPLLGS